jgi:uncharacterized protein (TIGR03083 family)
MEPDPAAVPGPVEPVADGVLWSSIEQGRRVLADQLAGLDDEQWSHASLCRGWLVRDVAAHLTLAFSTSKPQFAVQLVRSRGSIDAAMVALTARSVRRHPDAELVQLLRTNATHRFTPPRLGPLAPLTDLSIHTRDIQRPLGLPDTVGVATWTSILGFLLGFPRGFVPRWRLQGLSVRATDTTVTWGEGLEIAGPVEALALAVAGRSAALAQLSGPGVHELGHRLGADHDHDHDHEGHGHEGHGHEGHGHDHTGG